MFKKVVFAILVCVVGSLLVSFGTTLIWEVTESSFVSHIAFIILAIMLLVILDYYILIPFRIHLDRQRKRDDS